MTLTLEAEDLREVHGYVDASHALHPDAKSHTGLVVTLGRGAVLSKSSKQKLVAKSSTVAELVGLSDAVDYVLWIRLFLKEQGFDVKPAVLHQDNMSTIFLVEKGKSVNQRTRHIDIRYFSVHDSIEKKEIQVVYTKTGEMIADFFTKPLQGKLFMEMRSKILNPCNDMTTKEFQSGSLKLRVEDIETAPMKIGKKNDRVEHRSYRWSVGKQPMGPSTGTDSEEHSARKSGGKGIGRKIVGNQEEIGETLSQGCVEQ